MNMYELIKHILWYWWSGFTVFTAEIAVNYYQPLEIPHHKARKRKKILLYRPDQPRFSILEFAKTGKISCFCQSQRNFNWHFCKTLKIFSKIFSEKDFWEIPVFLGETFFHQNFKKIKIKMSPLTDPFWEVHLPVKQAFLYPIRMVVFQNMPSLFCCILRKLLE